MDVIHTEILATTGIFSKFLEKNTTTNLEKSCKVKFSKPTFEEKSYDTALDLSKNVTGMKYLLNTVQ